MKDEIDVYEAIKTEDGKKEVIERINTFINDKKIKGKKLKWYKKLIELVKVGNPTAIYIHCNC